MGHDTVTVSSKFQIVIPAALRAKLRLKPGSKLSLVEKDGVVYLIPIRPIGELFGSLAGSGITSEGMRDHRDRF